MAVLIFFSSAFLLSLSVFLFRNKLVTRLISLLYALIHIGLTIHSWMNLNSTELIYFTFSSSGVLLLAILSLLTIPTFYHGFVYTAKDDIRKYNIYHASLILLMTFMSGAYLANGMTVLWIFVEATTLAVAALIYHDRTEMALEATWKYVFICSTGIALAYLGILFLGFIYGRGDAANLTFENLSVIIDKANPLYLKIAFLFVLVGFSTKMGLFPMHTVTIDAHSVSPPPVSALISTTLMNVGFLSIFRVYSLFASSPIRSFMNNVLILAGILSLLIAAGYMLKAKHLKRMLAYSSLENMGLVAIATGIGGEGYYAAFLIIVLHSLIKSSLFYQMGQLSRVLHTFKLDDCGRYMALYPAGSLVLITGVICILGIPPSGLFISEIMIFRAMVTGSNWAVLIITFFLLCFVIYAMTTRTMHIVFSDPRSIPDQPQVTSVRAVETVSQFILLGLVVILCFYQPPFLTDIIKSNILTLGSF